MLDGVQRTALALVAMLCLPGPTWGAGPSNPNHEFFEVGLAVHGAEESKLLAGECQTLYESSFKATRDIVSRREKNQKIDPKLLADAHVSLLKLRRYALRLRNRAEPAGVDYDLRAVPLQIIVDGIILDLKKDPQAAKAINEIRQVVAKGDKQRAQSLDRIAKLIAQKDWPEADKELLRAAGKAPAEAGLPELDRLWEQAKAEERGS